MRTRVMAAMFAACALAAACAMLLCPTLGSPWLGLLAAVPIAACVGWLGTELGLRPTERALQQLEDGIRRLGERDFAARLTDSGSLPGLADTFHSLCDSLRKDRDTSAQSERMLRLLMDAAPMAIVLLGDAGRIVYTNETARELFFEGKSFEGHNFLTMLEKAPEPFRQALLANEDSLFTLDVGAEQETWHLSKRHFEMREETHALIMVKHLTRELRRQEIDVWKKLIRVISHELNNSLAPITSLMHSARLIANDSPLQPKLDRVFSTVEERATHLQQFIAGYAQFARLPKPRPEHVPLRVFAERSKTISPRTGWGEIPEGSGWFDPAQLEQVLINLLKNAEESGSEPDQIEVALCLSPNGELAIAVSDRGTGMSEEVLRHALLPFYSTKERGSGLGLALCREIVEAHGGKIRIQNREGGGVLVTLCLPGPQPALSSSTARLTLSRM